MNTFYEVLQLLKKHGTIIYTGDRQLDLELIEEELRELHSWKMIETNVFQQAILILRKERQGQM
ncbi:YqgQ family protein [Halalkalibacter urbisdiaboli]|uniref:YqgQ family protein n=1 Tax=Halalkalibacter urbisdiaboli TaxID=1960589 RepID=UPI000B44FC84|nr:YqgQ family protein [Halalkalibacter urbisdiaboli]